MNRLKIASFRCIQLTLLALLAVGCGTNAAVPAAFEEVTSDVAVVDIGDLPDTVAVDMLDTVVVLPDLPPAPDLPNEELAQETATDAAPDVAADTGLCKTDNDCPPDKDCQISKCDSKLGCIFVAASDDSGCDNGDLCNSGDLCKGGVCVAGPNKNCDDTNVCTTDSCVPESGKCVHLALDNTPCDDGDSCTANDSCKGGQCLGGLSTCACKIDIDCAPKPGDDLCAGSHYCDKALHVCAVDSNSAVICKPSANTQCAINTCDKATGLCGLQPIADQTACDDGKLCTIGDACIKGKCESGALTCCDSDAFCDKLSKENKCNGVLFCELSTGKCLVNPTKVVKCDASKDTFCEVSTCVPATGACLPKAVTELSPCNDDDPCTTGDACVKGKCTGNASLCECKVDGDCATKEDKTFVMARFIVTRSIFRTLARSTQRRLSLAQPAAIQFAARTLATF